MKYRDMMQGDSILAGKWAMGTMGEMDKAIDEHAEALAELLKE